MTTRFEGDSKTSFSSELYLELLKRALLGHLNADSSKLLPIGRARNPLKRGLQDVLARRGLVISQRISERRDERLEGRIWPLDALTMVGRPRLDNLQRCIESVIASGVPGDCIETGVWRGGASMFMRAVLNVYGERSRRVWVADSFRGLPPPDPRYLADASSRFHLAATLAISLEEVKSNFDRYGLLDDTVHFLEGWFEETLPSTHNETWAVIRLDGDMYQSTTDALQNLYPNLAVGGWAIIDDYAIEACRRAVDDFRRENSIVEPLEEIDWTGVCWQRTNR